MRMKRREYRARVKFDHTWQMCRMVNIVADVSKLIMTNIQINRRLVELVSLVVKIN